MVNEQGYEMKPCRKCKSEEAYPIPPYAHYLCYDCWMLFYNNKKEMRDKVIRYSGLDFSDTE